MNFSTYINESKRSNLSKFSEIKDEFVGTPMGQTVTISGVKMSMNGSKGDKYIIKVLEDGIVKDDNGDKHEVYSGDKIIVSQDGKELTVEEDNKNYSSFSKAKKELIERINMLDASHINSREDFINQISSIAELISYKLPPSKKKWK